MDEPEYICQDCGHQFDGDNFWSDKVPDVCPVCGSKDIISTEQAKENERINKRDEEREDRRLFR